MQARIEPLSKSNYNITSVEGFWTYKIQVFALTKQDKHGRSYHTVFV